MSALDYQPFYCEENIWKLCQRGVATGSQVLFLSNPARQVLLGEQRAGDSEAGVVIWDYHVILAEPDESGWRIRDLDTRLGDPCPWPLYRQSTFPPLLEKYADWAPWFRVVPAEQYLKIFCSDRRHMQEDGVWLHPPPEWPEIGDGFNLMRFVEMEETFVGEVMELPELESFLTAN